MLYFYISMVETPEEKTKVEQLYLNYRQTMYHVAYQILKDSFEAEDAVHGAFLRVIKNLDKIDETNSHRTRAFLVVITEHIAIDIYRKRKRETTVSYDELSMYIASQENLEEYSSKDLLATMNRLPVHYAAVLLLKYSQGYDDVEIATLLNITEENVRQRLSRGRKQLRKLMDLDGGSKSESEQQR